MTTIFYFILVLGFMVLIHELGHFLAARHVGVRVERFSIFFPLPFSSRFIPDSLYKKTIGDTEYVINWLPLGGYVKLTGQNLDDEDPADPVNYASKSKWRRAYILAAGPLMNLAAALVLMAAYHMIGVERLDYQPVVVRVEANSIADRAGLMAGDRIVRVGASEVADFKGLQDAMLDEVPRDSQVSMTVERDGQLRTVEVPTTGLMAGQPLGARYLIPPVVGHFSPDSPASAAGLNIGDRIISVDGRPVKIWDDISPAIQKGEGRPVVIEVERQATQISVTIPPRFNAGRKRWQIYIAPPTRVEQFGPLAAVAEGGKRLIALTDTTFRFLGQLITGRASLDAVGGPVKIAVVVGQFARGSLIDLIFLMAIISLQLGIFNLLPIPALDGGHLFLLGVEALKRSPLSRRIRERVQMVGLSLLLLLFVTITYNDIRMIYFTGSPG